MSSGQARPPAVRKHLMVPGQPRPAQRDSMSVTAVQRWVMSSLTAITILHLSAGLVVAAYFSDRTDSQIGLLVIAAAFGLIAFEAALLSTGTGRCPGGCCPAWCPRRSARS